MEGLLVEGQPVGLATQPLSLPKSPTEITLLRSDGKVLNINTTKRQTSVGESPFKFSLWGLGALFALIGATVLVRKPSLHTAWIFGAFTAFAAFALAIGPSAAGVGHRWSLISQNLTLAGIGASFLPFIVTLLVHPLQRRLSLALLLFAGAGLAIMGSYIATVLWNPSLYELVRPALHLYVSASILGGVVLLAIKAIREHSPAPRQQALIALWGIVVGVLPFVVFVLVPDSLGLGSLIPIHLAVLPLGIMPLSLIYAIEQHQLFGIRRLVHRGMVYGMTTFVLLLLVIVGVALAMALMDQREGGRAGSFVTVSAAIVVAGIVLFYLLRRGARWLADKLVYGDVVNYQSLVDAIRRDLFATKTNRDTLQAITQTLCRALSLESCLIFLGQKPSQAQLMATSGERAKEIAGIPELQSQAHIEYLKAKDLYEVPLESEPLMLVSLKLPDKYLGYMILGPKRRGEVFLEEERQMVATVAPLVAIAIDKSALSEELRELNQRLVKAEETERARIAGDLHDGPLQKAILLVGGDKVSRDTATNLAQEMVVELREISSRLHPAVLSDLGIMPALDWLLENTSKRFGIKARLFLVNLTEEERFSSDMELALFRIVQEATNNALKHARASALLVSLARQKNGLVLQVTDDGAGFDLTSVGKGGFGLIGMRERVTQFGGSFELNSAPGLGTTLLIQIPLADGSH